MRRSTRGVALLTLAVINVFTLAAGVTLVRVLPDRLAMLKPVRVASRADVQASPVLAGTSAAAVPTSSGLSSALSGALTSSALGPGVSAVVADESGQVLWSHDASQQATPASTQKVATAVAALDVLGPDAHFVTKVVSGSGGRIVLVGSEPGLPFDRTCLSKFVVAGQMSPSETPLLRPKEFYEARAIERIEAEVSRMDVARRNHQPYQRGEDHQRHHARLQQRDVIGNIGLRNPGRQLDGVVIDHRQNRSRLFRIMTRSD